VTTKDSRQWPAVVLGIVSLVLLAAGTYFALRTVFRTFTSLESGVATAVVTAATTVLVAVVTTFFGRYLEQRQAAQRAQQERRIPVYEDFIKGMLDVMGATVAPKQRQPMTEDRVLQVLAPFTQKVVVWGSDEVLRAWVDFRYRSMASPSQDDPEAVIYGLEDLLLAFRKDLGLSNKRLKRGDLLKLWVNDLPH
jgi:hypothetical protein